MDTAPRRYVNAYAVILGAPFSVVDPTFTLGKKSRNPKSRGKSRRNTELLVGSENMARQISVERIYPGFTMCTGCAAGVWLTNTRGDQNDHPSPEMRNV